MFQYVFLYYSDASSSTAQGIAVGVCLYIYILIYELFSHNMVMSRHQFVYSLCFNAFRVVIQDTSIPIRNQLSEALQDHNGMMIC